MPDVVQADDLPSATETGTPKSGADQQSERWTVRWINEPNAMLLILFLLIGWSLLRIGMNSSAALPVIQQSEAIEVPATLELALDLNTATVPQLMQVDGIGETLATRIIEYRNQHGKFTSLKQLEQVPGIGSKTLQSISESLQIPSDRSVE